jgi:hypothetical protein
MSTPLKAILELAIAAIQFGTAMVPLVTLILARRVGRKSNRSTGSQRRRKIGS